MKNLKDFELNFTVLNDNEQETLFFIKFYTFYFKMITTSVQFRTIFSGNTKGEVSLYC
jgi:hypothetical protein